MKVGDLVYDPEVMKKFPSNIINRTAGLIIASEDNGDNYPKSYCSCGENKHVVWWTTANIIYEQCECELKTTTSESKE